MEDWMQAVVGFIVTICALLVSFTFLSRLRGNFESGSGEPHLCIRCGRPMRQYKGRWHCDRCNDYCRGCGFAVSKGDTVCPGCGNALGFGKNRQTQGMTPQGMSSGSQVCIKCGASKERFGGFWHCPNCESCCTECGFVVDDDARTCPNCKAEFEEGGADDDSAHSCSVCGTTKEEYVGEWWCPKCEGFCENCDAIVSKKALICPNCGAELGISQGADATAPPDERPPTCKKCGAKEDRYEAFWHCESCDSYCEDCGFVVADDARSCPNCGAKFETGGETASETSPDGPARCKRCGGRMEGYKKFVHCPNCDTVCEDCGFIVSEDATRCPNCRAYF